MSFFFLFGVKWKFLFGGMRWNLGMEFILQPWHDPLKIVVFAEISMQKKFMKFHFPRKT